MTFSIKLSPEFSLLLLDWLSSIKYLQVKGSIMVVIYNLCIPEIMQYHFFETDFNFFHVVNSYVEH